MELNYLHGNEGRAFFVKGFVPLDEFMAAVSKEVEVGDPILGEKAAHCWMRVCRDFQEEHAVYVEAKPESRGAFRVTWIQEN